MVLLNRRVSSHGVSLGRTGGFHLLEGPAQGNRKDLKARQSLDSTATVPKEMSCLTGKDLCKKEEGSEADEYSHPGIFQGESGHLDSLLLTLTIAAFNR